MIYKIINVFLIFSFVFLFSVLSFIPVALIIKGVQDLNKEKEQINIIINKIEQSEKRIICAIENQPDIICK